MVGGVQKGQNLDNVIYGWSLKVDTSNFQVLSTTFSAHDHFLVAVIFSTSYFLSKRFIGNCSPE